MQSSYKTFSKESLYKFLTDSVDDFLALRDHSFRSEISREVKSIMGSLLKNLGVGEIGKRGEQLFVAQFILVCLIMFGVPGILGIVFRLIGAILYCCGLYGLIRGMWDLKHNITPFISPIPGNKLIQTGLYAYVRHPLYGALITWCLGVSILSGSIDRLVLTLALVGLLDYKAGQEERLLRELHPLLYDIYAAQTRKLFLYVY
jgi:protein-S-isoprenylcysteine O-methyltransferase Ste14